MNFINQLLQAEHQNQSMLCVGLDPEPSKFPHHYRHDSSKIFDFCAQIVDATCDVAMAFKPQIAYFSANRAEDQLEQLVAHIRHVAPNVPVILDAKRGDIGSTAQQYAIEAFERYGADAVTLSPFMGFDSLEPYLQYHNKGAFLLCRTSNGGGNDLQAKRLMNAENRLPNHPFDQPFLYEYIAHLIQNDWNTNGQLGLVVGATYPEEMQTIRTIAPTVPLLVPGVGAQGGNAIATVKASWRGDANGKTLAPIVVNSSRAILYASAETNFAQTARAVALQTRDVLNAAKQMQYQSTI